MIKKLLCKFTLQHNRYIITTFCTGIYSDSNGYDLITCNTCMTVEKRKCTLSHCDCCGKHCTAEEVFFKPWHLLCKCNNCQIRRTLSKRLWKVDKVLFLNLYTSLIRSHGQTKVDNALSTNEYIEIIKEMQKYKVLL
jgi:hypothetical protein